MRRHGLSNHFRGMPHKGIIVNKEAKSINTSNNRGMKDFKTAESIRFVNTFYGDDFKLLKYQKIDDVKRN